MNLNETDIESLLYILTQEKEKLGSLLELSHAKTAFITNADVENLSELIRQETMILGEMAMLDKKRTSCADVIADNMGIKKSDINLTALIKAIPTDDDRRMACKLQEELKAIVSELKKRNKTTNELIELQMGYTNTMLTLFLQGVTVHNTYTMSGDEDNYSEGKGYIDAYV